MTNASTAPNGALRAARLAARLSQDELAAALRRAGADTASKRTVQRLESGAVRAPRPATVRALEAVFRAPIETLGFGADDAAADGLPASPHEGGATYPGLASARAGEPLDGIWLSHYAYHSSGRGADHTGDHHVVLQQRGQVVTGQSIPGSATNPGSRLTLRFELESSILTGSWREATGADGYYRGATYWGAIHLVVSPNGRRLAGQWLGFGSEGEVNNGAWWLQLRSRSTAPAEVERFAAPPPAPDPA